MCSVNREANGSESLINLGGVVVSFPSADLGGVSEREAWVARGKKASHDIWASGKRGTMNHSAVISYMYKLALCRCSSLGQFTSHVF